MFGTDENCLLPHKKKGKILTCIEHKKLTALGNSA